MKVLLVSTNRESLPDPVAPLGAAYVAAALKQAGHDVRLLDLQFAPDVHLALKDAYRGYRPGVVGLSIRNVDNVAFPQTVSYVPELVAMVRVLKSAGAKLIIPGGSGFTLMPTELLQAMDLDLGIAGEAEESFPELLRRIEERQRVDDIPGLVYRYGGKYHVNKHRRYVDLNDTPGPDRELIENALYLSEGGAGNLQTKRGCSFGCTYCTYPLVEGRKVRLRDPAKAAAEFEVAVRKYGLRHIFIVDNVFNHPIEHAKMHLSLIQAGDPPIKHDLQVGMRRFQPMHQWIIERRHLADRLLDRRIVEDVEHARRDVGDLAVRGDELRVHVGRVDVRAFGRHQQRGRAADALAGGGHERGLSR